MCDRWSGESRFLPSQQFGKTTDASRNASEAHFCGGAVFDVSAPPGSRRQCQPATPALCGVVAMASPASILRPNGIGWMDLPFVVPAR